MYTMSVQCSFDRLDPTMGNRNHLNAVGLRVITTNVDGYAYKACKDALQQREKAYDVLKQASEAREDAREARELARIQFQEVSQKNRGEILLLSEQLKAALAVTSPMPDCASMAEDLREHDLHNQQIDNLMVERWRLRRKATLAREDWQRAIKAHEATLGPLTKAGEDLEDAKEAFKNTVLDIVSVPDEHWSSAEVEYVPSTACFHAHFGDKNPWSQYYGHYVLHPDGVITRECVPESFSA